MLLQITHTRLQHYSFGPCFLAPHWVVWEEAGILEQSPFPMHLVRFLWTSRAAELDCRARKEFEFY